MSGENYFWHLDHFIACINPWYTQSIQSTYIAIAGMIIAITCHSPVHGLAWWLLKINFVICFHGSVHIDITFIVKGSQQIGTRLVSAEIFTLRKWTKWMYLARLLIVTEASGKLPWHRDPITDGLLESIRFKIFHWSRDTGDSSDAVDLWIIRMHRKFSFDFFRLQEWLLLKNIPMWTTAFPLILLPYSVSNLLQGPVNDWSNRGKYPPAISSFRPDTIRTTGIQYNRSHQYHHWLSDFHKLDEIGYPWSVIQSEFGSTPRAGGPSIFYLQFHSAFSKAAFIPLIASASQGLHPFPASEALIPETAPCTSICLQ